MKPFALLRIAALPALALSFSSCETMQNSQTASDPYASNYTDGGYNPYPGQTGYGASGGNVGTYTPPPPPSDPYAFSPPSEPAPAPVRSTSSSSSSSTKKTSSSSSSYSRYTVKKGDTLYSLARKNGTSVSKIKSANGMSSDLIRIGQTLKIP